MSQPAKHAHLRNLIASSLLLGVLIGVIGNFLPPGNAQHLIWALNSFCVIIGATLLGSKLTREDHDIPAAGFIILGIGNAMLYGFIAAHDTGHEQFGAGIMIYMPGLLLISMYDRSHLLLRALGFVSAAAFGALAMIIYLGGDVPRYYPVLEPIAYITLNAVLVWWSVLLLRQKA